MSRDCECYCVVNGSPKADCFSCSGTGYRTRNTSEPICPWCGEVMSEEELHQSTERDCDHCEKEVEIEVDHTPTYTTTRYVPRTKGTGGNA